MQTGDGILDKNMYAYCMNNPINRVDTNGKFWKGIGGLFISVTNAILSVFGASSQVSVVEEKTDYLTSNISPVFLKTGSTISTVKSRKGTSSKPISVYANGVSNNPLASTAGIKINIAKYSFDIGIGLTDTSLKFSISKGDITTSSALKIDITKLQIGFEMEVETKIDTDIYSSGYANASVNAGFLGAMYMLFNTGNLNSSVQYAYQIKSIIF